jgi:RimJ/RimL family protein N-acetyltransferase
MAANIRVLSSERLILQPPHAEDDEAVADLRSNPIILKYLEFLPKACTVDEARLRRETRAADDRIVDFHIHLRSPDPDLKSSFIGSTGLFDINLQNMSCECGIVLTPSLQRKGLGTEALYSVLTYAFEDLGLHRVTLETAHNNVLLRGWFENALGVQPEFRLREAWKGRKAGTWVDAIGYSILVFSFPFNQLDFKSNNS